MVLKTLSRMSILSLLLLTSHEPMATSAMDITDDSTHEQVFSSPDGADSEDQPESLGDQMQDSIDDEEPNDAVVSVVDGKEKDGDYVEESDTPDGRHIRKEVHQGPGFKTVRITQEGGSGPSIGGPGRGPSLMQAMMQDMMQQMAGQVAQREQPKKQETKEKVIEMNGPMGRVVMRKRIPFDEDEHDKDDHEDEGGIPPEILQMIRMTEAMHQRAAGGMIASPFGRPVPRQLQIQKDDKDDGIPRHEEAHSDIMKRMNKISEEIGEKHDEDKLMRLQETKTTRSLQAVAAVGVVMLIMFVSFMASCLGGKPKNDNEGEDVDEHTNSSLKRVGKAD